jgi:hypothetical protein
MRVAMTGMTMTGMTMTTMRDDEHSSTDYPAS